LTLPSLLDEEWNDQEREFRHRTKVLQRVSSQFPKDSDVYSILWERELQVRNLERRCLLLRRAVFDDEINPKIEVVRTLKVPADLNGDDPHEIFYDATDAAAMDDLDDLEQEKQQKLLYTKEFAWLALDGKMMLGTSWNLMLYMWANMVIDESLQMTKELIIPALWLESSRQGWAFYTVYTLCGFGMLRFSRVLYWFASPRANSVIKFDLHNGIRLQDSMALLAERIQKNVIASTFVFLLSYAIVNDGITFSSGHVCVFLFGDMTWISSVYLYDATVLVLTLKLLERRGFEL